MILYLQAASCGRRSTRHCWPTWRRGSSSCQLLPILEPAPASCRQILTRPSSRLVAEVLESPSWRWLVEFPGPQPRRCYWAALFLLGCHSTLFGPVKLPRCCPSTGRLRRRQRADPGAGTFVAILLGLRWGDGRCWLTDNGDLWLPAAGWWRWPRSYLLSRRLPRRQAGRRSISETWRNIEAAPRIGRLFLAIMGISWFCGCTARCSGSVSSLRQRTCWRAAVLRAQ